jgi:cell division protein FtsB
MLEERAREVLNYTREDEVVVMTAPDDKIETSAAR